MIPVVKRKTIQEDGSMIQPEDRQEPFQPGEQDAPSVCLL